LPYHRHFRIGPFGFGFGLPVWWEEPPYWVDVERTADEMILNLRIPRDVKKEEIKVEYSDGRLRIRYPRRRAEWERIPIE